MPAYMHKNACTRSGHLCSPCSRGTHGAVAARNVSVNSSVVPPSDRDAHSIDDLMSHDKKWQIGMEMQRQLRDAVKVEDFATAARCRDAIAQLSLSPIQSLEMSMAEQLIDDACSYDEKARSLKRLSFLHPTDETQALIVEQIKDEALTTVAQQVIQAIWLRHPNNWRVNELLEEGCKGIEMAAGCKDVHNSPLQPALAKFEEAASLDPTFPETWNKIATVLYLTRQYAESIQACEQVLHLNPQHYLALSGKGLCHFYLNERKEAEKCWKEALQINPFLTQFRRFLSASETGEL